MGAINRLPLGLLGFLGIKNGGRYPDDISNILSPVWDLRELYQQSNSEIDNVIQAVSATGNSSYTTVPNGEAWYVFQQSAVTGDLTAGQSLAMTTNWTDPASLVNISTGPETRTATVGQRCVAVLGTPYYAAPGSKLGVTVTVLAAGPVNVRLVTRFARLLL